MHRRTLGVVTALLFAHAGARADPPPKSIPAAPSERRPAWVEALFKSFQTVPAKRLRLTDSVLVPVPGQKKPAAKALVSFTYRDAQGKEKEARATVYLPQAIEADAKAKVPLFFAAGYPDDSAALAQVRRGWAAVTPRDLEANPLVRTANPDIALLHIARALPFVDDTRVVIGGNSAGGWMTLLLAAETFPLGGAAAGAPPVNLGYNGAYFFKQKDLATTPRQGETKPRVPVLSVVLQLLDPMRKVYGEDYGDETWFRHSPVAHVSTITAPVSVWFSTADVLVPIDQVGAKWVRPFDKKQFPEGFTMSPEKLTRTREGRVRLLDVLAKKDCEVFDLPLPKQPAPGKEVIELPVSAARQWSIAIIDEGPPDPQKGHTNYVFRPTWDEFLKRAVEGKVPAGQLTMPKLQRLMDRYAGKEWLPSKLKHLDFPESERADVLRGLRTYVSAGAENARTFACLYAELPRARQVLGAGVVKELTGKDGK